MTNAARKKAVADCQQRIHHAITTRAINKETVDRLKNEDREWAREAHDVAEVIGFVPNATSKSDKAANKDIVSDYRDRFGEGFTVYQSTGTAIDTAAMTADQREVYDTLPRKITCTFYVARSTK